MYIGRFFLLYILLAVIGFWPLAIGCRLFRYTEFHRGKTEFHGGRLCFIDNLLTNACFFRNYLSIKYRVPLRSPSFLITCFTIS